MDIDSISLKSKLLKAPSLECKPSIMYNGVPSPRIPIVVPRPGRPSVCLKFTPAIFPARAVVACVAALCPSFEAPIDEIAPVSDCFFIGLPYPVITTSSMSVLFSTSSIVKSVFAPTTNCCISYPRKEICNTSRGAASMEKFPSESVKVPRVVPRTTILAPTAGRPSGVNTCPETFCAGFCTSYAEDSDGDADTRTNTVPGIPPPNKNRNKINVLFISEVLGWVNKRSSGIQSGSAGKYHMRFGFSRTNDKITYRS